jgi:hypothetical protein
MPVGDGPTAASGSMICFRAEDAEGTPRKKIEIRDPGLLSDLCVRNPREIARSRTSRNAKKVNKALMSSFRLCLLCDLLFAVFDHFPDDGAIPPQWSDLSL